MRGNLGAVGGDGKATIIMGDMNMAGAAGEVAEGLEGMMITITMVDTIIDGVVEEDGVDGEVEGVAATEAIEIPSRLFLPCPRFHPCSVTGAAVVPRAGHHGVKRSGRKWKPGARISASVLKNGAKR